MVLLKEDPQEKKMADFQ